MADDTQIREGHDRIAKRLFAHADVVAEMLRRFLPQGLLPEFDPATLRRFPAERVDARLAGGGEVSARPVGVHAGEVLSSA